MNTTIIRFEIASREWIAQRVINEADTSWLTVIKLARKGPPWPSGEAYRAAKRRAAELLAADQALPPETEANTAD